MASDTATPDVQAQILTKLAQLEELIKRPASLRSISRAELAAEWDITPRALANIEMMMDPKTGKPLLPRIPLIRQPRYLCSDVERFIREHGNKFPS